MNMENRIVDAFKQLCKDNSKQNETMFFHELKSGTLWVPVILDKGNNGAVQVMVMVTSSGRKYIPAFANREDARRPYKKSQLIKMDYRKIKSLLLNERQDVNGIIISPLIDNVVIDRALIRIIDGKTRNYS